VTVSGRNAPVLALCRALIEAGHDPNTPLEAYRGATLCLRVRSIGEGAKLTVKETCRDGKPRFVPFQPFCDGDESYRGRRTAGETAEGGTSVTPPCPKRLRRDAHNSGAA
jgi:hypothetical protein